MARTYTVTSAQHGAGYINAVTYDTLKDALYAIAELRRWEARWPIGRPRRVTLTSTT